MKFFIDECLSPLLAQWLAQQGIDAVAARDMGRLGQRDDTVRDRCIAEDRIIVTHDARDFRKLVGRVELHPGLVILPETAAAEAIGHMRAVLRYLRKEANPDARSWMVNRVIDVRPDGRVRAESLPAP